LALTLLAAAILTFAAWAAGAAALAMLRCLEVRHFERLSLELTAGFGIVAAILSAALLLDLFAFATGLLLLTFAGALAILARAPRRSTNETPTRSDFSENTPSTRLLIAVLAVAAIAWPAQPRR
jgi:hypothetical protein